MHRSIRWLVGTLASILGLGLLLVRWGLWASDSRLVVENTHAVRSILTAAQNEPAFLIYGVVVFLLLVGFDPDTHFQMAEVGYWPQAE